MADIELVIKIPEELYIACEKLCKTHHLSRVEDAIGKGTPLPEHHSELVDKREVYKKFYNRCLAHIVGEVLSEVKTIIPATKEPTRTMIDCYKCKNRMLDISCAECHFEPKAHGCEHCANAKDYSEDGFYCAAKNEYRRASVGCEKFTPITDEWVEDLEQ